MASGGQFVQEDMSCGKSCIVTGTCPMRGHVIQEEMFYSENIMRSEMSYYMMTCFVQF